MVDDEVLVEGADVVGVAATAGGGATTALTALGEVSANGCTAAVAALKAAGEHIL